MNTITPSFRAQLVTRRTYNRPLNEDGALFETWDQTIDRVISHQEWLWERAKRAPLNENEHAELGALRELLVSRKVGLAGRTNWLGGTDLSKQLEGTQFNCAFTSVKTVYDVVDLFWLLLLGVGPGSKPMPGVLNGFTSPVEIEVIRSTRNGKGREQNSEAFYSRDDQEIWHLTIGDSAKSWAKSVGKIIAMKRRVDKIILDFSEIRPAGTRLKGFGWICSGDEQIATALINICKIFSKRAGQLLTSIDILDLVNWLGTCLSSRRSAEIVLMDAHDQEAEEFALAKKNMYANGNYQREQSNNSLIFWNKPSKNELRGLFQQMIESGGSEPGFVNGVEAKRRAPWFAGLNPCGEILLGDKAFCNLVTVDWGKFIGDEEGHMEAIRLAARANYRQTCVNLKDNILSDSWHELNEFLRLCGTAPAGVVKWMDGTQGNHAYIMARARNAAVSGANSMADELGLPRPKAVTTVKPDGTFGKIADTTEGVHRPLGKYIFNKINFSVHDPLVELLRQANYEVAPNPTNSSSVLVTIPVAYDGVKFTKTDTGLEINTESAVSQLERYKMLMDNYVDHNCSITVYYDPSELTDIVNWLHANWDSYVGVSWLFRDDPTKTAEDLGYAYLPQKVVTEEQYTAYISTLKPVNLDAGNSHDMVDDAACATGSCPIR